MDRVYLENRDKTFTTRYKLNRRIQEVFLAIRNYKSGVGLSILEVGCADGVILTYLKKNLVLDKAVGIEPSLDCIKMSKYRDIILIRAVGEYLPFREDSFDVIVAASVIDHLSEVDLFLEEVKRTLRPRGILVVTAVVPFYDRLANITGLDKGLHPHIRCFGLRQIKETLQKHDFLILSAEKFAMPTFGFLFFEKIFEKIFKKLHLGFIMFYSLVVARK